MPIESISDLIQHARAHRYALGYFESWNLESLAGVIDAVEETSSPVIIGFNGDFLSRAGRLATERLKWYAALGRAAGESASVPCGLIFNECPVDAWVMQAAKVGFNLVMPADPETTYEDYVQRVVRITQEAHARNVAVEAEVGHLPDGTGGLVDGGVATDPEQAADFVERTDVDLLAVSVGNVHALADGDRGLDLERLGQIHRQVSVPLVLHGGTGIRDDSLTEAIGLGVVKVNYGTYIKQRYLNALRIALRQTEDPGNPHLLLGIGGHEDMMVAGRHAVRDAVLERIHRLGCCGKA